MSSLNKACLIGNVGKDPEIRSMNGGDKVANFSIATSESWKDRNTGERKERTEWHRVVVWGALAEVVEKYVSKGDKLYVEGKIQTRKWTDQSGVEKYSTEIVLQGFGAVLTMLSPKGDGGGRSQSRDEGGGGFNSGGGGSGGYREDFSGNLDDEIPF